VDPDDPQAIGAAIAYLRAHPQIAMDMGKRGRAVALAKYNWSTEREKLVHLYRDLSKCVPQPKFVAQRESLNSDRHAA
jgi:glycosyltransferase involved in cell wall biosynthesis